MYPRTSKYKVENQVDHKCDNFCCFAEKHPNGMSDSLLLEPLLKNHSVNCLRSNKDKDPYKDHMRVFRALARYMNGHNGLDSHFSGYFREFITKSGHDP